MKNKILIITNESIYIDKDRKFYCDNIDLKSIPEELNNFTEVVIIGRLSKIKRTKEIKIKNINVFNNIFSFLYFISKNCKYTDCKYFIISLSPYTFLTCVLLKFFSRKHFIYLRSDGYEEYKTILGNFGKFIYHLMFKISALKAQLIACRKHLLRNKKGTIVNPSQLNDTWFKDQKDKNLKNIKLLYVGRVRIEKGIFSLINLIKNSNLPLTIVTSEANVKIKNKSDNINVISFKNYDDAIIKFYDEHNIFILPSYTEAHPQVLDESLARLRPVVIFKEIEHVKRNREGVFVCDRNYKSLENTINYINNNYENIVYRIKKNDLPTKKNFINELKKIIIS